MKKIKMMILLVSVSFLGFSDARAGAETALLQNDLLAEYEQRLVLIEKQFAEYKKQLDPEKMKTMDNKMKVGAFENNRNTLKSKLKDLRNAGTPISETDQADLSKRFEQLTTQFEQLKKTTE